MPFVLAAVLAAVMPLLQAAVGLPAIDNSRTRFTARGLTRYWWQQCNSRNWVAAVAPAAADANQGARCAHTQYNTSAIDNGYNERDRRACRAWGLAVDRGRRIQGLRYDYDHQPRPLAHDRRDAVRGAVRARPGRCVAPGIGRGRGGRVLRVAAPETEKKVNANRCSCCRSCFPKGKP